MNALVLFLLQAELMIVAAERGGLKDRKYT